MTPEQLRIYHEEHEGLEGCVHFMIFMPFMVKNERMDRARILRAGERRRDQILYAPSIFLATSL